jgi:modulator of FtsH protease
MNPIRPQAIALPHGGTESILASNKVIRNTYMLLSLTLAFAAVTAGVSAALKLSHPGILLTLFVSIFNLFTSLLQLLGFMSGDD